MRKVFVVALFMIFPSLARAEAPAQDVLTEDESLTMCAEALSQHLECKQDFCAAVAKMRASGDKSADLAAMEKRCLEEIAVDGTGDLATRKARCAGWAKNRPKMSMLRAEAKELAACWTKATCKQKIDCWAPRFKKRIDAIKATNAVKAAKK